VTWDVDSGNTSVSGRVRRFVFGHNGKWNEKAYRYPGFVERPGVRYLGQSVLFVGAADLRPLQSFLVEQHVAHVVTHATLGIRVYPPHTG